MFFPNTKWTITFMSIVALQSVIDIALEAVVLANYASNINAINCITITVPVYMAIFVFAHLFQLVLAYDALRLKNTIQIIGLCIFNLAFLLYAILQINQIQDALDPDSYQPSKICPNTNFGALSTNAEDNYADHYLSSYAYSGKLFVQRLRPILITIPVLIGIAELAYLFQAWKLYQEFGWKIYKRIGADVKMKNMYMYYQIFICLIKYDFFFFLGFTIQFIVIVLNDKDIEFALTIVVMPLTFLLLIMAVIGVRYESKTLMSIFLVGCVGGLAYFFFKTIRMYEPSQKAKYANSIRTLTVFSVFSIIMIFATIAVAIICMFNFDKGLKEHVVSERRTPEEWKAEGRGQDMKEHRLTLD